MKIKEVSDGVYLQKKEVDIQDFATKNIVPLVEKFAEKNQKLGKYYAKTFFYIRINESYSSFPDVQIVLKNSLNRLKENDITNSIVNKGFSHLRFTKNLFNNIFVEFFVQYGFNDFLLMKERLLYGSVLDIGFLTAKK